MIKRNLYYYIGLLSGLFLIACSDQIGDSGPSVGQGQDEGTYLFIQVGNSDRSAQTKTMAYENLRHTEELWSVCALVFNEKDVLETVGTYFTLKDNEMNVGGSVRGFLRAFSVNSGKKKIMLCANIGETLPNSTNTEFTHSVFKEGQTLEQVQNLVKQYEDANFGNEIMGHVTRLWLGETDPWQKPCRLSLNSGIYDVEILPGVVNCLGMTDAKMNGANIEDMASQPVTLPKYNLDPSTTVDLYFNTALVRLSKITVKVKDKKTYPNARLDVTKIFVLNAKNKTKLIGKDGKAWGTTFVAGNSLGGDKEDASGAYSNQLVSVYKGAEVLSSTYNEKFQPRAKGETNEDALTFENECLYFLDSNCKDVSLGYPDFGSRQNPHGIGSTVLVEWQSSKVSGRCRYGIEEFFVYENTDVNDPTLLVVQGNFTYDDPNEEDGRASENCYYVVKIGEGVDHSKLNILPVGNREEGELQGLLRNVRYNITMTITQPGASSPLDVLTKSGSSSSACVAETEVTAM